MNGETTVVAVFGTNFSLSDIYSNSATSSQTNLTALMVGTTPGPNATCYIFNGDGDSVIENNEKAYLVINFGSDYTLASYQKLKIEIRTNKGAALMIQRDIPGGLPTNGEVDLG
jgi:archaellin